ncbi:MAG: NAD(P)/FAD-dependent oxidoreductase [Candidatus Saccharibacteria bacterium]
MRYLIIGGSIASVGAIEGIRSIDREGHITVVTNEPNPFYSRPLISYYLAGKIGADQLYYRPTNFYKANNVEVVIQKVENIDSIRRMAVLADGQELEWNRLLIASGGRPLLFDAFSQGRENVVGFYTLEDEKKVRDFVQAGTRVVIIGAGLVGLKAAEALYYTGADITVADAVPGVLPATLDEEASLLVQHHLERKGIKFKLGYKVASVNGIPLANSVLFENGDSLPCDLVIVTAGTCANLAIVEGTTVQTDRGIIVNEYQQTNIDGIFAAGDVAEALDILSGQRRVMPLLPVAYEQGRTAGVNMAGREYRYRGSLALNSTSLLGLPIMSAGNSKADGIVINWGDPDCPRYRKIVLRDGVPVGFVAINNAVKMGIITELVRKQINVSGREARLLDPEFTGIEFIDLIESGQGR